MLSLTLPGIFLSFSFLPIFFALKRHPFRFTAWAGKVFDNVTYAEYGSFGPGYVPSERLLDQESLGTAKEGNAKYNLASVFGE